MSRFDRQRIWITGASSGIGEALAYVLSGKRARLILTARREDALARVRAGCAEPDQHLVEPADLASDRRLNELADRIWNRVGPVDVLINNAGVSQRSYALETGLDVDRRIMEINYFAAIALTKALAPAMVQRGQGQIVCVSSVVGKLGTPLRSAYAASKHALHGFMDSLRAEIAGQGVSVTLVCPGFVRTNISRCALTMDGSPHGVEDAGQARGMDPLDCANRIAHAIERRRSEVYVGGPEIALIYVKRFLPKLCEVLVSKLKGT